MEKPNERQGDEILLEAISDDGSVVEFRRGHDGVPYSVFRNEKGEITEVSALTPFTEEGDIREYFSARGIALTGEEVERLKWKFQEMKGERENEILDAQFEAFDEEKAREQ